MGAPLLVVPSPEDWPWSSYLATAGLGGVPDLLATDWVLSRFSFNRRKSCRLYSEFVYQGLGHSSPWESLRGGVLLGNEDFVGQFQSLLSEKNGLEEIPRSQRLVHRPTLERLLTTEVFNRARGATEAHIEWGYTLKEIAQYWGIHYSTVSRMIKGSEVGLLHRKTLYLGNPATF